MLLEICCDDLLALVIVSIRTIIILIPYLEGTEGYFCREEKDQKLFRLLFFSP